MPENSRSMLSLRHVILLVLALSGLAIGAFFAFSMDKGKDFATVEINGASLMAEVVSNRAAWARGLSGRTALGEREAMLFVFDKPDRYAIWMKEMLFPLDIFWIRNGAIADIEENVPMPAPGITDTALPVYRSDGEAEMVLETRAGFARKHSVKIGDRVRISGTGGQGTTGTGAMLSTSGNVGGAQTIGDRLRPGEEFTIEALRRNSARGREFRIGEAIPTGGAYEKFPITYRSGALTLTGIMNVPAGSAPEGGFPVLVLNHGLIDPAIYASGRGSRREQDFFARHGYVTLHPDYRGYASSSPNPAAHHDFYVGYAQDVMALIDAIKNYDGPLMDAGRIGMWGHSMGGGIAARAMTLSPDIRAYVLFAPISADAEENFYELTLEEIAWLRGQYGEEGADIYRRISPIAYFADVSAPVQLHHGAADRDVPIAFSEKMFEKLTALNKKAELFTYPGEGHEFADAWQTAADRALQFFDLYVKNAR